jgi:hypothetical protein
MIDRPTIVEVLRHPNGRDWLVKCEGILPWPIWYKQKADAVSYAQWIAQDHDAAVKIHEPV